MFNIINFMKSKKNKYFYIPLILWMIIIFYFSHQPVNESSQLSEGISKPIVEKLESNIKTDIVEEKFDYLIRKIAHFTEYMILGILMYIASSKNNIPRNKKVLWCILLCALYAITDEVHQAFVPGRAPRVFDVLIDTAGSITGILMTKFIIK